MPALGLALPGTFPEVEAALRLTGGGRSLLKYDNNEGVYAEQLRSASANFFKFFDFPLLQGDPDNALAEPFSLVLTETLAKKLFGDSNPMGKTVKTGGGFIKIAAYFSVFG